MTSYAHQCKGVLIKLTLVKICPKLCKIVFPLEYFQEDFSRVVLLGTYKMF